jgi:hypothetical protein
MPRRGTCPRRGKPERAGRNRSDGSPGATKTAHFVVCSTHHVNQARAGVIRLRQGKALCAATPRSPVGESTPRIHAQKKTPRLHQMADAASIGRDWGGTRSRQGMKRSNPEVRPLGDSSCLGSDCDEHPRNAADHCRAADARADPCPVYRAGRPVPKACADGRRTRQG